MYFFLKKHIIIFGHMSFIFGTLPCTIPFTGLFHYKTRCRSIASVIKRIGPFKWNIVSIKNAITFFNLADRTWEGWSTNKCCNIYVGQKSNSQSGWSWRRAATFWRSCKRGTWRSSQSIISKWLLLQQQMSRWLLTLPWIALLIHRADAESSSEGGVRKIVTKFTTIFYWGGP